ncbi:MAG: hypothetical protein JW864_08580 [Spirochaetes bacterium]|nr:hypothetical protein [Spirochaetota bacterium]
MRINTLSVLMLNLSLIIMMSCSTGDQTRKDDNINSTIADNSPIDVEPEEVRRPREYNFRFIGYDINIDDPAWDRRSYYRIYLDKIDAGRTTIGLESQQKTFESKISSNRHLLVVEKWALDEKKGQYIKLNNIEQPKPHYIYFNLPKDKAAVITLKNDPFTNKSDFEVVYE